MSDKNYGLELYKMIMEGDSCGFPYEFKMMFGDLCAECEKMYGEQPRVEIFLKEVNHEENNG